MRIVPLGGAEEIGASCTYIEIGKRRLVIDCGIRTGSGATDPLPNLSALTDLGGVDAILVTHAHLDHTGALPVLHQAFPAAPVYATGATHALIRVMLGDALKVMADRYEREQEVPLYSAEAVASLLARAVPVNFCQLTTILSGDVGVTFFPAGHVLGAAMIGLEGEDGSALFTGDYSVSPQRTVEGLLAPRFAPDVLITESTYGDRLHANRRVEERRLAETVATVVEGGGKALIPAFALGRAQEVILILQQFQRDGHIPRFPVWVDGMVKNICGVYSSQSESLSRDLRRRLSHEGKIFFREAEGFRPVAPPGRDAVLSGGPCAIISSSGMLTGGPSLFYARRLASDGRSAILITGYQDEESPGRRLLDLASADAADRKLTIEGQSVPVGCRVEKYGLSAHADSGEMSGLAAKLAPRDVILVHGSGDARERLAGLMRGRTHLPSACDEMTFDRARRSRAVRVPQAPGQGGGRPIDDAGLEALRARLLDEGKGQALFSVEDLAARWYGAVPSPEQVQATRDLLMLRSPHFTPDVRRPFLFRPARTRGATPVEEPAAEAFPVDQMRAVNLAGEVFEGCDDLYKRGAYTDERKLVLYFHFPDVARARYVERIGTLAERSGWTVEVWPEAHLGVLTRAVEEVLPAGCRLTRTPSYYREQKMMKARVEGGEAAALEAARDAFHEKTGFALEFQAAQAVATPLPAVSAAGAGQPLEINTAYAAVDRRLRPLGLLKRGLKRDATGQAFIELSWISPQVAQRHAAEVEAAAREVGWVLRINPEPNQNAIKERARGLVPAEWGVTRDPAFRKDDPLLRLKVRMLPDPAVVEALSQRLLDDTGYGLAVET